MIGYLGDAFLILGSIIIVSGGIGIIRFPEFFSRLHAAGVIDTIGTTCISIGVILHHEFDIFALKIFLLAVFLFITSPINTHSLSKSAYIVLYKKTEKD